jgi:hypothetical protein
MAAIDRATCTLVQANACQREGSDAEGGGNGLKRSICNRDARVGAIQWCNPWIAQSDATLSGAPAPARP